MKFLVAIVLLGLVAVALASESEDRKLFEEFRQKHNRVYFSEAENERRFHIFQENLRKAEERNQRDPSAVHGVTRFMDLTPSEFKSLYLMNEASLNQTLPYGQVAKVTRSSALPTTFDWRNNKTPVVTAVKNQEQCGSCWDFSATETAESVWALAGNPLQILSEQQVVDCDTSGEDQGCNGGWPYGAYEYIIQAGGYETESDYPYTGEDGTCQFNAADIVAKFQNWEYVTQSQDEKAMQQFLYTNSPLSVCVDAETWQTYTSGVITSASDCGTSLDHCVQATGWGVDPSAGNYWNVRNSWDTTWGEEGFIFIQMGSNVCGIAQVVTVPCVATCPSA